MTIEREWRRVATALALVAVVGGVVACGGGAEAGELVAEAMEQADDRRRINVEVETLQRVPFREIMRLTGTTQADRDVTVAAEESGVVRALLVEKGARVEAGQAIIKIDDEVLRAQFEQAEAQAALAQETYERQRRLWEEEQIGSELAYLETKYSAQIAAANAKVLAARLERTTVRAPVAGILDDRLVEIGAMVSTGTPVARIIDPDPVEVVAGVPERFAGSVMQGAEAIVVLDALGGRRFEGRIAFVGASIDERSRTFPIEIVVPNPGGEIKPGMIATLQIVQNVLDGALVVPQSAILRSEEGFIVYVAVERDGVTLAEARQIEPGATHLGRVVIESGLQPGDRLIVVGHQELAAGDRLNIVAGD